MGRCCIRPTQQRDWNPPKRLKDQKIGTLPFLAVRYSILIKIVDAHDWTKKTYNNAVSALRRAFAFGFEDHPEQHNPAKALRSARISKKDRPPIDPFSMHEAEILIAAIHRDWGEARATTMSFASSRD